MSPCCRAAGVGLLILAGVTTSAAQAPPKAAAKEQALRAHQQAEDFRKKGNTTKAIEQYELVVKLAPAAYGTNHPSTAIYQYNLAKLYLETDNMAKAEPMFLASIKIWDAQTTGEHDLLKAKALADLGLARYVRARYREAQEPFKRSLQIRGAKLGDNDPLVAATADNLGLAYYEDAQWAKAEPLFHRSRRIWETHGAKHEPQLATTLNNLGLLYRALGQYTRAEALYKDSLQIREERLGKESSQAAETLNNLGSLYSTLGQYEKAEDHLQRGLEIREKSLGKDDPAVANSLNNLALLYHYHFWRGQVERAEPLYLRCRTIFEKHLGPKHPHVATCLTNLGSLYSFQAKYPQAEPLYLEGLKIREDHLGVEHPHVAVSLNNLAELYSKTDRHRQAEELLERALKIQRQTYKDEDWRISLPLGNLAVARAAQGRWREASTAADESRRITRRYIGQVLPTLAEAEQLDYLRTSDRPWFHEALSLSLAQREDPSLAVLSAGWVLNGKAIAHQTMAELPLLIRDHPDPKIKALVERLQVGKEAIAGLAFTKVADARHADQIAEQLQENEKLSVRVRQLLGQRASKSDWIELGTVRQALPRDAVLIEIVRLEVRNIQAKGKDRTWLPAHYVAWLIPPSGAGQVEVVDLGEAAAIDSAIKTMRETLGAAAGAGDKPSTLRELGPARAEAILRQDLDAVAKLVLKPLLGRIGQVERWIISPDADLWLVPWAALPRNEQQYAVEKHRFGFVVSGRDLVGRPDDARPTAPLILANPNYDLRPARPAEATKGTGDALLGHADALPATALEAQALLPALASYAGAQPQLKTEHEALEGVFKKSRAPQVVAMCTHGFVLDEKASLVPDALHSGTPPALRRRLQPLSNPLLRCGLLFAGCNQRAKGRDAHGDDGVLTGLEIVGTDLRGTELVILSACDTGLGRVQPGEGVAGLRQAFQLAGADCVVASLWAVNDVATAELMGEFCRRLSKDKSKADALREAQLAFIKNRRDRQGHAHPFLWAAFTATGK